MTRTKSAALSVLACAIPLLAGCFTYHRAADARLPPEPLAADAWVRPDTDSLREFIETPALIRRYEVDHEALAAEFPQLTPDKLEQVAEEAARLHAIEVTEIRLAEGGLIRLWNDTREPDADTRKPRFFSFGGRVERFIERGAFLTPDALAWRLANDASRERHALPDRPPYTGTDVRAVTRTDAGASFRLRDGYALGYSFPQDEPAGLVVHLTSLIQNKYEHAIVRRFKGWGWAVAHLDTEVSVRGPLAEAAMDRRNEREALLESRMPQHSQEFSDRVRNNDVPSFEEIISRNNRRFEIGQELKKELPDLGTGFELTPDSDPNAAAESIARAVDLRLSEHADAAAALVASLDAMRPELASRPIVITGFSAGALAAPAVAARLREAHPDRPIFIVLAGGGGSLLDIAMGSQLTNGGIQLHAPADPKPTPEQIAILTQRYELESRLDPLRAARALRDVPVLHIYADKDTVVPTEAAERFNAVHASVDRLVHRGNHDTLLYFLNSQASYIRSWLRTHGVD